MVYPGKEKGEIKNGRNYIRCYTNWNSSGIDSLCKIRYIEKHDFYWSYDKWFIHIKVNVETEEDVLKLP